MGHRSFCRRLSPLLGELSAAFWRAERCPRTASTKSRNYAPRYRRSLSSFSSVQCSAVRARQQPTNRTYIHTYIHTYIVCTYCLLCY
ncbi:hypothetical protein LY76DRAFT_283539 [Colletotrichum caudatum]|nr:hypothetical protein LY76DRAFT_283539 [Colletotrichum caudatum]